MKYAILGARSLLGLIFVVFGLNGFLQFIPLPPMGEQAGAFMGIFFGSGWGVIVKVIEIVFGLLLLSGLRTPLALTFLAPVVVNIFLFHALLDPGGMGMSILLVVLTGFLIYAYRDRFAGIFSGTEFMPE